MTVTRVALLASCLFSAGWLIGCQATSPESMGHLDLSVTDTAPAVRTPIISGVPTRTPGMTVAIQGKSDGARIVVQAAGQTSLEHPVYPTGDFCIDMPLAMGRTTTFTVIALSSDGQLSNPAFVQVMQDPTAPAPVNPTCGSSSGICGPVEICNNGKDDDCNGFTDGCDPACNGCIDDALEPSNNPLTAPSVSPGNYSLQICACRPDWFAFNVRQGAVIHTTAQYSTAASFDLNMRLYRIADVQAMMDTPVAMSTQNLGMEEILWTVDMPGTYLLRVWDPIDPNANGGYTFNVF